MTSSREMTEEAAKAIYRLMPYDGPPELGKPDWVEGGNSHRQDEARNYARAALSTLPPPPSDATEGDLMGFATGSSCDQGSDEMFSPDAPTTPPATEGEEDAVLRRTKPVGETEMVAAGVERGQPSSLTPPLDLAEVSASEPTLVERKSEPSGYGIEPNEPGPAFHNGLEPLDLASLRKEAEHWQTRYHDMGTAQPVIAIAADRVIRMCIEGLEQAAQAKIGAANTDVARLRERLREAIKRYENCRDNRPLVHTMRGDDPLTVGDIREAADALEHLEAENGRLEDEWRDRHAIQHATIAALRDDLSNIGNAVSLEIGDDCTVREFCKVIAEFQRDSMERDALRDALEDLGNKIDCEYEGICAEGWGDLGNALDMLREWRDTARTALSNTARRAET